ncbi:TVP38/TMEM64 family protein [Enterococcus pallens]|uniref:TVP38/TMEM64 family membrane protein n=1 Tax=Enterococcus pallens ATCC BAA-351 TaxID=1158607 RepID=R2SK04_9ENTE|nr:VTT domain-containing protein [Enterococcus pallens]EOH93226.1 hypothetical protein UAU_02869 [Enterococcus pallens ATCC BAA-351]EOU25012.1 hypothetical protein I588_01000 [Enterococcus pallens ATCC BAA-351]OJG76107.1 hypothetical protein RV10_GL004217 [Enterococcus pallens]
MSDQKTVYRILGHLKTIFKFLGVLILLFLLFYTIHYGMKHVTQLLYQIVKKTGFWGPFIFILFQIAQVVLPILPGGTSLSIGILAFGQWIGFVYNYIGIVLGSILSFLLIRHFGKSLLRIFVSEKTAKKYLAYLDNKKKFTRFFIFAILFPVAPDDLLCMIAGLSTMKFRTFVLTIVLGKPISIYLYGTVITALIQRFL